MVRKTTKKYVSATKDVRKMKFSEFLERSKIRHPDKNYDYSLITEDNWSGAKGVVVIICPLHGKFEQIARSHYRGSGCWDCATIGKINNCPAKTKLSQEDIEKYISTCNDRYHNYYDYSKANIETLSDMITVVCPMHGDIVVKAKSHKLGKQCKKCSNKKGGEKRTIKTSTFIERSKEINGNRYLYDRSIYTRINEPIIVGCKLHGYFTTTPTNHYYGQQCKLCVPNRRTSMREEAWLNSLNLPFDNQHRQIKINVPGRYFQVDGFDPKTNTVYEFLGDYWHGNPNVFHPDDINKMSGKLYRELYNKCMDKLYAIKKAGYNLIYIWEDDWAKKVSAIRKKTFKENKNYPLR